MSNLAPCRMTLEDRSKLEALLAAWPFEDRQFNDLLRRKIESASIWPREDIAPTIVTLDSRVSYRVGERPAEIRILSLHESHGPVGTVLPVTTLRGLALIGLDEGESFELLRDGERESITVVSAEEPVSRFYPVETDHDDPGPSAA